MKHKLLLSSIAIAAAAAVVGGGTYAAYTDTEVDDVAVVTAGTLDLTVGGAAATADYSFNNAYPGYSTGATNGFILTNSGSIDGNLRVYLVKDSDADISCAEPEGVTEGLPCSADGEIDKWLKVTVDGNSFGPAASGAGVSWMGLQKLDPGEKEDITGMIWGPNPKFVPAGASYPGGASPLYFGWTIHSNATNEIQSDSLGFHLEFVLDQA